MSTATESNGTATAYDPFDYTASSGGDGGNYQTCPAGSYLGALIAIIDLGTHEDEYQGVAKKARQAALIFEIDEAQPNGKPFVFAKQINLPKAGKLNEKATLRVLLEKWLGRNLGKDEGGNIRQQLGKSGVVTIANKTNGDKTYDSFAGIGPLMRGQSFTPTLPTFAFVLDPSRPDDVPKEEWLPRLYGQTIADKIGMSEEFKALRVQHKNTAQQADDDDIPF